MPESLHTFKDPGIPPPNMYTITLSLAIRKDFLLSGTTTTHTREQLWENECVFSQIADPHVVSTRLQSSIPEVYTETTGCMSSSRSPSAACRLTRVGPSFLPHICIEAILFVVIEDDFGITFGVPKLFIFFGKEVSCLRPVLELYLEFSIRILFAIFK